MPDFFSDIGSNVSDEPTATTSGLPDFFSDIGSNVSDEPAPTSAPAAPAYAPMPEMPFFKSTVPAADAALPAPLHAAPAPPAAQSAPASTNSVLAMLGSMPTPLNTPSAVTTPMPVATAPGGDATAPDTAPAERPRRPSRIAAVARWLLVLLWLAAAGITALIGVRLLGYSKQLLAAQPVALPGQLQDILASLPAEQHAAILKNASAASLGTAVVAALIGMGLIARWRWALVVSLLVGVFIGMVGVVLAVVSSPRFGGDIIGVGDTLGVSSQVGGIIAAAVLLIPLVLSFMAWPQFFGRKGKK